MTAQPWSHLPLEELVMGARFLRQLPHFLRRPVRGEEARAVLRHRLEHRNADFLALARTMIFDRPDSPYRTLLAHAGCCYGDLERLVRIEGLEPALQVLYRAGVYLTVDEMKGRRPVVRGGKPMSLEPSRLRNPTAAPHLVTRSSGTRGPQTPIPIDLASVRDQAVDLRLFLEAWGSGVEFAHAVWGVPGGASLGAILRFAASGYPPRGWFTYVDPRGAGLHARYGWSDRAVRWGSWLAGVPLPAPQYAPLREPRAVATWLAAQPRAGRRGHLWTFPTSALAVCRYARQVGVPLEGALFSIAGEAITETRLAAIRTMGADALVGYGSTETGTIGNGCLRPNAPDDVHFLSDLHAVIQPDARTLPDGLRSGSLLFSSLRPTARLVLLNVSLGDQAVLEDRSCGCALERVGWTTHLRMVRSYEKLTAAGMTFLSAHVLHVLEEILPSRFGGAATDYQLLEEEAEDGQPRLRLLVSPAVGRVDLDAVGDAFLSAIGRGSGVDRIMSLAWREAAIIRVEQRLPESTPGGKILHLVETRRSSSARRP
jgi:hypothetical protein